MSSPTAPQVLSALRSFSRDLFFFGGSHLFARAVTIILGLYLANRVGPTEFGVWGLISVFAVYGLYAHLGAAHAMQREIPVALSQGRENHAENIAQSALGFCLFLGLGLGAVVAGLLVLFPAQESAVMRHSLWLLVPMLVAQLLFVWMHSYLRARRRFYQLAAGWFCQASLLMAVSLLLIPGLGVRGYVLAWAASYTGVLGVMMLLRVFSPRPVCSPSQWLWLVRTGLPLMLLSMMFAFITGVDRLLVAALLTTESVGYYTTSIVPLTLGIVACQLFAETLYPRMAATYGRTNSVQATLDYFLTPWKGLCWLLPVAQGAAILVIAPVFRWLLPAYGAAIAPAQILVAGLSFFGTGQLLAYYFSVIGEERTVLQIQAIVLLLKVLLLGGVVYAFRSLEAVALASALTSAGYAVAMTIWAGAKQRATLRLMGYLVLPWLGWTSLALATAALMSSLRNSGMLGGLFAGVAGYSVVSALLLYSVHRGRGSLRRFADWMREAAR